jgi:hypothetical protein
MDMTNRRVLAAVTAAAAVCAMGLMIPQDAGASVREAAHASAVPGTRLWIKRYNGPHNSDDGPSSMVVSPGGRQVFVTGVSVRSAAGDFGDYATVAYDARTGALLWGRRYNGPGKGTDVAASVAVSPGGTRVFVTGSSMRNKSTSDYATIAYNAATGAQLWVRRFGPGSASAVAVGPGGRTVFVTGTGATSGGDFATVAYNAATGARLWVRRYNSSGNSGDAATSLALSPRGGKVFVTGDSGAGPGDDYATVAYSALTGARLWVRRYHGAANQTDDARSVVISPPGGKVFVTFVTGDRRGASRRNAYATAAYSAATGAQLWVRRYRGPANGWDDPRSLAASRTGKTVLVTGVSERTAATSDYATIAYNAATGGRVWVRRYEGPGNGGGAGESVAVGPDGRTVFVTGITAAGHFATVAYRAATGARLWARTYNGPGSGDEFSASVAVSPAGARVFVTGASPGVTSGVDFATIGYSS